MRKRVYAVILMIAMTAALLAGCGEPKEKRLEGTSQEILNRIYETADLDADFKAGMENFQTTPLDESIEEYLIGTTGVNYTDAVCSAPMINVVAYQCVVLRLAEGEDVAAAKQLLLDNADPRKWVCVEAESVVVENVGDVILYVMGDKANTEALKTAFLAL